MLFDTMEMKKGNLTTDNFWYEKEKERKWEREKKEKSQRWNLGYGL